jgi:hypothetical protein
MPRNCSAIPTACSKNLRAMASLILVGKNICMHLYPLIQKNFQLKHIDPHIQIYNKDIKDVLGLGSEILRSLGFSFIFSSLFAHDSPWIIFCGNLGTRRHRQSTRTHTSHCCCSWCCCCTSFKRFSRSHSRVQLQGPRALHGNLTVYSNYTWQRHKGKRRDGREEGGTFL